MPAAIYTVGKTAIRDLLKTGFSPSIGLSDDNAAFNAAQTSVNPTGGATVALVKTATIANVDDSTYDATISVINASSHRLLETIDLQKLGFGPTAKPHHAQVEPDGQFWYATLIGANRVLKFDRENRIVASLIWRFGGADDPLKNLIRAIFVGPRQEAEEERP